VNDRFCVGYLEITLHVLPTFQYLVGFGHNHWEFETGEWWTYFGSLGQYTIVEDDWLGISYFLFCCPGSWTDMGAVANNDGSVCLRVHRLLCYFGNVSYPAKELHFSRAWKIAHVFGHGSHCFFSTWGCGVVCCMSFPWYLLNVSKPIIHHPYFDDHPCMVNVCKCADGFLLLY